MSFYSTSSNTRRYQTMVLQILSKRPDLFRDQSAGNSKADNEGNAKWEELCFKIRSEKYSIHRKI